MRDRTPCKRPPSRPCQARCRCGISLWWRGQPWMSVSTLALEHLDRLHHAGLHSSQRLGQNADFVVTAGTKVSCLEIAEAYFVGKPCQPFDASGHEPVQHQIQHDNGENE